MSGVFVQRESFEKRMCRCNGVACEGTELRKSGGTKGLGVLPKDEMNRYPKLVAGGEEDSAVVST